MAKPTYRDRSETISTASLDRLADLLVDVRCYVRDGNPSREYGLECLRRAEALLISSRVKEPEADVYAELADRYPADGEPLVHVPSHGYTNETFAIASTLTGNSGPVDGAGLAHRAELRRRLRAYLDEAEQPTRYSGQRFDAAQGLASLLADILRERRVR